MTACLKRRLRCGIHWRIALSNKFTASNYCRRISGVGIDVANGAKSNPRADMSATTVSCSANAPAGTYNQSCHILSLLSIRLYI